MRFGLVGDLHGAFDAVDASILDARGYERLVFVGDLGPGTYEADRRVARAIGRLRTPVVVMPGNNDCEHAPMIRAELGYQRGVAELLQRSGASTRSGLERASGDVVFAGYALHPLTERVTMLSARPYSMGGPEMAFAEALAERHGIASLEASTERLVGLVDAIETEAMIVLAHNGPSGLGADRHSIWGRDFTEEPADHGDPDLEAAIAHAKRRGIAVLAVFAGHMHLGLRGGGERVSRVVVDDTLYLNPARVPRVVATRTSMVRHHVEVTIEGSLVEATDVFVDDDGMPVDPPPPRART